MTDTRLGARLPRRDLLTRMPNHHLRNSPQLTVVFFTQTSDCAAAMQPEARCLLLVLFVCLLKSIKERFLLSLQETLFLESGCKGTHFFNTLQIFQEKNAFL